MSKNNQLTGIRRPDRRRFLRYLGAAPTLPAFAGAALLSSPSAFAEVVLTQPRAQTGGFGAHDRILPGIVVGIAAENLYSDQRFLDFGVSAGQMLLHDKAQETRQALVSGESRACQHPFQLAPRGFYI